MTLRSSSLAIAALLTLSGCGRGGPSTGTLELVWGRLGTGDGRLQKPRAITIDANDQLYIVDMTARIQVFDRDGRFLRVWSTPAHDIGRPVGLDVNRAGDILVADTHYHQILVYSPQGEKKQQIGGKEGHGPGEFAFISHAVQDRQGNYYISEFGENERIQKFSADGTYLTQWGRSGSEPGQFLRPQSLALDADDHLWVADACNHRIQVFDGEGKILRIWGHEGKQPGELSYPYGVVLDGHDHVCVIEYGNHRVQKFTLDGQSLGCWGHEGKAEGELYNPWSLAIDREGAIHVLDTNNHRVQRIKL